MKAASIFLLLFLFPIFCSGQINYTIQSKPGSIRISRSDNPKKEDTEKPKIQLSEHKDTVSEEKILIRLRVSDKSMINYIAVFDDSGKSIHFAKNTNYLNFKLNLKEGKNNFTVEAQDYYRNTQIKSFSIEKKSHRRDYALLFAVQDYSDAEKWRSPHNVRSDAERLQKVLEEKYGFETELVMNPTSETTEAKLIEYAAKEYNRNDQLLIFWSGHGSMKQIGVRKRGYFVSSDCEKISHGEFSYFADAVRCKHVLIVADACYSGLMDISGYKTEGDIESIIDDDMYGQHDLNRIIKGQLNKKTRKVIASAETESPEGWRGEGSPFMNKLIETLKNDNDRIVEYYEIKSKLAELSSPGPVSGYFSESDAPQSNFLFIKTKPQSK